MFKIINNSVHTWQDRYESKIGQTGHHIHWNSYQLEEVTHMIISLR